MIGALFSLAKPALHALDPETAHQLTIRGLSLMPVTPAPKDDPRLGIGVFGQPFPNPVGLAAGFDKQCEVPDQLLSLGFGFVELGGVVPKPQEGNPRPRVFRLTRDEAIINRFGLNSDGLATARGRLARRRGRPGIVGVNIGANKDSTDRIGDYVECIRELCGLAGFLTINVSSPNTPGLRALQSRDSFEELVRRVLAARGAARPPLFVKVAPDVEEADIDDIAGVAIDLGIDGLIVSNTTIARPRLRSEHAAEAGGLSGAPLFAHSTAVLRRFRQRTQGRVALIGVGGVRDGMGAYTKIRAGADLVQLYTGMVYGGPGLVGKIKRELAALLRRDGFKSVTQAVGLDA